MSGLCDRVVDAETRFLSNGPLTLFELVLGALRFIRLSLRRRRLWPLRTSSSASTWLCIWSARSGLVRSETVERQVNRHRCPRSVNPGADHTTCLAPIWQSAVIWPA